MYSFETESYISITPHLFDLIRLQFVLVITFFAAGCLQLPEADYYERDGIVSLELSSEENSGQQFSTSVYIGAPGSYTIWMLGKSLGGGDADHHLVPYRILDSEGFLVTEGRIEGPEKHRFEWVSRLPGQQENAVAGIPRAGLYTLTLDLRDVSQNTLRKLHLTRNNSYPPTGTGLPETDHPSDDPKLLKRDQSIAIPPSFAFGVMVSSDTQRSLMDQADEWIGEKNIAAGAFWVEDTEVNRLSSNTDGLGRTAKGAKINKSGVKTEMLTEAAKALTDGADFLILPPDTEFPVVREATGLMRETGKRQFMLTDMSNLFEPDVKSYPANRVGLTGEEADPFSVLKEHVEMISNPRLALYEIPFVLHDIRFFSEMDWNNPETEEAYIRWVQFSAFASLMHVWLPDETSVSPTIIEQLSKLSGLRGRLFPYLYSTAHLARPTREKPVRGEAGRSEQFMLGDAFLVAPILEQGTEERTVHFPEGTWYDYWDGTTYQGRQSWIVETPLTKTPVFVKAGSIIPYSREQANTLDIDIYTGGVSSFRLYEDDGRSDAYLRGEFSTTAFRYFETDGYATFTIGRRVRGYRGQYDQTKMHLTFHFADEPAELFANSEPLQRGEEEGEWHYDDSEKKIYIRWTQPHSQKTDFEIRF